MQNQEPDIEEPGLAQMIKEALEFLQSSVTIAPLVKPGLRKPARPSTTLPRTSLSDAHDSTNIRKSMRVKDVSEQHDQS